MDTNRPLQFQKRSQLIICVHDEALAVVADARQQSRSFARENPLLRRSRQLYPVLGIVDYLRRRFARFKLGAHLLDLRGLLFHRCCESLNFLSLLRDRSLEVLL